MGKIYCNADIKKFGDLKARNAAGHNLRQIPSDNVDPKKSHLNRYFIGSSKMSYDDVLNANLSKIKTIRKNAVKTVNLVFSASPDLFNDKKKGKAWEDLTWNFIKNEFGEENVLYAVVHKDELSPHFQVAITPIKDGKLNASYWFDGRKKCNDFLTRYHNSIKHLGIKRDKGAEKAKPQDTRDYYVKIKEDKDFDKNVDKAVEELDKNLSSGFGIIKVSTAKKLFQPFYDIIKRYKAKALEDKKKIEDAKKIAQENDDLKLKFDNLGLSHEMKFSECKEVGKLISDGRTAEAERKANASKVNENMAKISPQMAVEKKFGMN